MSVMKEAIKIAVENKNSKTSAKKNVKRNPRSYRDFDLISQADVEKNRMRAIVSNIRSLAGPVEENSNTLPIALAVSFLNAVL